MIPDCWAISPSTIPSIQAPRVLESNSTIQRRPQQPSLAPGVPLCTTSTAGPHIPTETLSPTPRATLTLVQPLSPQHPPNWRQEFIFHGFGSSHSPDIEMGPCSVKCGNLITPGNNTPISRVQIYTGLYVIINYFNYRLYNMYKLCWQRHSTDFFDSAFSAES